MDQDYYKQTATNFISNPNIKNPDQFPMIMESYDKQISEKFGIPYQQQLNYQSKQLQVQEENTLSNQFHRQQITDQDRLFQYSQTLEQAKIHQENNKPFQQKYLLMDHMLGNNFVPATQNFLDYNVNSNCLGQMVKQPTYLRDPYDIEQFQKKQIQYLQALNDPTPPEEAKLFKQNIQQLGGIEDTIGNMQQTLTQFEIKHLNNKNIKYYPYQQQPTPEEIEIQRQQQNFPHPFLYNPAEDKDRFVYGPLQPARSIVDQQQTYTSNFYQTMNQNQEQQFYQVQRQQQQQQQQSQQQQQQSQQYQNAQYQQQHQFDSIEQSKRLRMIKLQQLQQLNSSNK